MPIKWNDGVSWLEGAPKVYTNTSWTEYPVKVHDGTSWTTVHSPTTTIAESGRVSLSTTIDGGVTASVSFSKTYTNPVVVTYIPTRAGGQSINCRAKDVTGSGCTIFNEEPDNGGHNTETVCYIVMEAGAWVTPEGVQIEAGVHSTSTCARSSTLNTGANDGTSVGDTVSFSSAFSATPAVLSGLQSYNNAEFMATTANTVATTDFLLAQEAAHTGNHSSAVTEDLSWIAIDTGSGTLNGYTYEVGTGSDGTNDGVDNTPHSISFAQTYGSTPEIAVSQNTRNGTDGAWARGDGTWSTTAHETYAEEDQVNDTERGHTDETFGWFAIDPGATIIA